MKKTINTILAALAVVGCTETPTNVSMKNMTPDIYPDYTGVEVPATIAPLNFGMANDGSEWMDVTVSNSRGMTIHANGSHASFDIDEWKALTQSSKGDSLKVTVCSKESRFWFRYNPFHIYISTDTIAAYGLTYRRLSPTYNIFSKFMGIYCRDLSSYDETLVISNGLNNNMCVNCHTQNQSSTSDMVVHIRGSRPGTYIRHNGTEEVIDTRLDSLMSACVYNYWHPTGKYIAFSNNLTKQKFHVGGDKRIEVFDQGSDIVIYDVENHTIVRQPQIMTDSLYETYPVFSPDGKWLYFCSCVAPKNKDCTDYWYDIRRIAFDETTCAVHGEIETIVDVASGKQNAVFPRISPDGKYLMYTKSDYSSFTIWHKEADLWMMNIETREAYPLDKANSDDAESYHNWSADSRWFVFTSRRDDGLHTRLYMAHVDDKGQCAKAFMLPQENPKEYYRNLFESYNTPDFCDKKVEINHRWLQGGLQNGPRKVSLK